MQCIIWPEKIFGVYLEITFALTVVDEIHITLLVLVGVGEGRGGVGRIDDGRIDDEGSWSVDGTGCGRMLVVGMSITEIFWAGEGVYGLGWWVGG